MIVLRAVLFNLVLFGSGAVFLSLALPALLLPRRVTILVGDIWFSFVLAALRLICGISHEIRGARIFPTRPRSSRPSTNRPGTPSHSSPSSTMAPT